MAMRLSGMMSGMDTESLVQELVAARKTKVDKVKKTQIRTQWKQDAWKGINTKLKNLQNKYLSNMRFTSSYNKKTTKVSDSNIASVITGGNAVNGTQELEVTQLAKTGYLTGENLSGDKKFTALSKMSDVMGESFEGETKLNLNVGGKESEITLNADSTISDVLNQLKDKGLNASFDEKQQRFFINSKESGEINDFSISAVAGDENSAKALKALGLDANNGAVKLDGQDAIIKLNGAEFKNKTNTFEINGLTITAQATTKPGESISLTTENDTSGIYDMIKGFLKEYNSVINELDKLYNAESSTSYDPLLSEEKEALTDTEISEWEDKIKSGLFRRDAGISEISSAMRSAMTSGVTIGGREFHLQDFGIDNLGYFNAADNEKNAFHIDGDPDDDSTSGNADKLKSMIASDPDTVVTFFTKLSQNLYGKMSELSKSKEGYRSYGNFYDDKRLQTEYDDYTTKINSLEEKLNDYEDKWYKKFSKMETAMAKMQSNANAVTSLFGGQ